MGSLHPRRAQLRALFRRSNAQSPACTPEVKGPFCSNCPAPQRGYSVTNANTATSACGAAQLHHTVPPSISMDSTAASPSVRLRLRWSSSHTKQRNITFLLLSSQRVHQALRQNLLDFYSHLTSTAAVLDNSRQSHDFQNPGDTTQRKGITPVRKGS